MSAAGGRTENGGRKCPLGLGEARAASRVRAFSMKDGTFQAEGAAGKGEEVGQGRQALGTTNAPVGVIGKRPETDLGAHL